VGRAYRAASAATARRQLRDVAAWLEPNGHDAAAASLREGLKETLTVLTLGLSPRLRRFFTTTNAIENLIGPWRPRDARHRPPARGRGRARRVIPGFGPAPATNRCPQCL
jgi:hypothetical protein